MTSNTLTCGRENDLIGFLYGELNESEALAFGRHLHECSACNTELAGLGPVRESIVAWRNEWLGSIRLPAMADHSPAMPAPSRPSAMAAWRAFFELSPLWMKGAVAFAAIAFCVFAGLAVASLRVRPQSAAVAAPSNSSQEFNVAVEARLREELQRIKDANAEQSASALAENNRAQKNSDKRITNHNPEIGRINSSQKARRPLSKTEREQLAADLRLGSAGDSDLDLLDDKINQ